MTPRPHRAGPTPVDRALKSLLQSCDAGSFLPLVVAEQLGLEELAHLGLRVLACHLPHRACRGVTARAESRQSRGLSATVCLQLTFNFCPLFVLEDMRPDELVPPEEELAAVSSKPYRHTNHAHSPELLPRSLACRMSRATLSRPCPCRTCNSLRLAEVPSLVDGKPRRGLCLRGHVYVQGHKIFHACFCLADA